MIVTCIQRYYDSKRKKLFEIGEVADINPLSPEALYFDGWPPGTEVYTKSKGVEGTRIVPGKVETSEETSKVEAKETSKWEAEELEEESKDEVKKSITADKPSHKFFKK